MPDPDPITPDAISEAYLTKDVRRMAALARARPGDLIAVAGARGLDYLMALFRSGFERGLSICPARPGACGETLDHVFVCDPLCDERLRALIKAVAPRLGVNGSLVVRLRDIEQDQVVAQALAAAGLADACPVFDASRDLLVSRCFRPMQVLAAAA